MSAIVNKCPICETELVIKGERIEAAIDPKAPVKELKKCFPVVLYFETEAGRQELIDSCKAMKNLRTRKL